jgi:hypothetical protein
VTNQGPRAIAIGQECAQTTQSTGSIAIGYAAARDNQNANSIAIGTFAALQFQGTNAIALGAFAGQTSQSTNSIAIGCNAGNANQHSNAIAIGTSAGATRQSTNAIAIGSNAGNFQQGANAIAIGNQAGATGQSSNSIILNASGTALNNAANVGLFINPVEFITGGKNLVSYNPTTYEVYYSDTLTLSSLTASGAITGGSKAFYIDHPVVSSCKLAHISVEAPRADLIYRNRKQLINGTVEVDLETECTYNGSKMSPGTFDALATNAQVFLQNNETFDRVKGYVSSHMLFITCENVESSVFIDWMVVAERHDQNLVSDSSRLTDSNGFLILEHYLSTMSFETLSG